MRGKQLLFGSLALLGMALLVSLGVWQLQRREWKHDLLARVEQRVHAPPIAAPPRERFDPRAHEYQAVELRGRFLNDRETLVQANTRLGGGFWLMTPLRTDDGQTVLVNRGFVAAEQREARPWRSVEGDVALAGLIRISEPGGGYLRDNDPGAERWYSRDVVAIARARGLGEVAPYFVDAGATEEQAAQGFQGPWGGMTVLRFRDNHLQYALTWFALALLLAGGCFRILRR